MNDAESTEDLVLPIHVEGASTDLGPWAARAKALEWPCATPKTPLLEHLSKMTPKREPKVHAHRFIDEKYVDYLIGLCSKC